MAAVCIRCGSKEHTTREHDEQKGPGKPGGAGDKPKRPATAAAGGKKPAAENKALTRITRLSHPKCWDPCRKPLGIPDIIDKPLRDRFYKDPAQESWFHREDCGCAVCEKKAARRRLDLQRRLGPKHQ